MSWQSTILFAFESGVKFDHFVKQLGILAATKKPRTASGFSPWYRNPSQASDCCFFPLYIWRLLQDQTTTKKLLCSARNQTRRESRQASDVYVLPIF